MGRGGRARSEEVTAEHASCWPATIGAPVVHARWVHAINHALASNIGQTVEYTDPVAAHPVNEIESLRELVKDMNAGAVETAHHCRRQPCV